MHTVRARSIQYPYYFSRISWPHGGPSSIPRTVDTEHDLTLNILYYESILLLLASTTLQQFMHTTSRVSTQYCICRHDVLASMYYHRVKKYQYLVYSESSSMQYQYAHYIHSSYAQYAYQLGSVRSEVDKRKICKLSQLLLQYYNAKNTEQASHVFMTIYMVRIPSFMVRIP